MRASRGMGDIRPSKMPNKPKTIIRKDDPNKVYEYKKGGKTSLQNGSNGGLFI